MMMINLPRSSFSCQSSRATMNRVTRCDHRQVLCFREDSTSPQFFPSVVRELPSGAMEFAPAGGFQHFQRFQQPDGASSSSSNNRGSGNNNDDGSNRRRGWRSHGDNHDSGNDSTLVAVKVLLTFSALHLGYCITAWMRKDGYKLGIEFYGLGLGLVCFLATAAVFVSLGAVSSDKFAVMWTCLAAVIATGEKHFVRKHGRFSGFVFLFGVTSLATLCF